MKIEPQLAKKEVTITKDRKMIPEKILTILVDVREQPIQHPESRKKEWKKCIQEKERLMRPPLWSSGQSSWLQIRRPGFDSRHYQIF
jgi:hypothetical protein